MRRIWSCITALTFSYIVFNRRNQLFIPPSYFLVRWKVRRKDTAYLLVDLIAFHLLVDLFGVIFVIVRILWWFFPKYWLFRAMELVWFLRLMFRNGMFEFLNYRSTRLPVDVIFQTFKIDIVNRFSILSIQSVR